MNIIGVDGGFSNLGWAAVELGASGVRILAADCIITKKNPRKVLATHDNIERTRILVRGFAAALKEYQPVALAVESMSWPRNASVTGKMGISWGVVITLAELNDLPIIPTSPQGIKKALTGKISGSKEEMRATLLAYPGFARLAGILEKGPLPRGRHEHPVDAAAAVVAALDTEIMRAIRQAGAGR